MKFSGHETFHVRENWLTKGLSLLKKSPEKFHDQYMHDWLGVGSNMGKSIKHWLLVTGLAEPHAETRGQIQPSALGKLISSKDRYMLDPFTWWVLHINLVHEVDKATSWNWFFNHFHQTQFKKEHCVLKLIQFLERKGNKTLPGKNTLDRDISCLLSGYAKVIPDFSDPEENYMSPFADLGLLNYFTDTNSYHLNFGFKDIPACALGYSLSKSFWDETVSESNVSLDEVVSDENGPGRCFLMRPSEIFDLVEQIEKNRPELGIGIFTLAGKRDVKFPMKSTIEWIKFHFENSGR